jgi:hypothetical protein
MNASLISTARVRACRCNGVEEGEHLSQLVHGIGRQSLRIVAFVQAPEAFMDNVANPHYVKCGLTGYGSSQERQNVDRTDDLARAVYAWADRKKQFTVRQIGLASRAEELDASCARQPDVVSRRARRPAL